MSERKLVGAYSTFPKDICKVYKFNSSANELELDESKFQYDLPLLEKTDGRVEDLCNSINRYKCGIFPDPPVGFHWELVASDQLLDMGYCILGTYIVDHTNKDEIVVPLYKFKDEADLVIPTTGVKLVLRESYTAKLIYTSGTPQGEINNNMNNNMMNPMMMNPVMMQQMMQMQMMQMQQNQGLSQPTLNRQIRKGGNKFA